METINMKPHPKNIKFLEEYYNVGKVCDKSNRTWKTASPSIWYNEDDILVDNVEVEEDDTI